jgi:hypothetical protein
MDGNDCRKDIMEGSRCETSHRFEGGGTCLNHPCGCSIDSSGKFNGPHGADERICQYPQTPMLTPGFANVGPSRDGILRQFGE